MNPRLIAFVIVEVLLLGLLYAAGAFTEWSGDVRAWSELTRAVGATVFFGSQLLLVGELIKSDVKE